jgi:hypothetical protein
MRVLLPLLVLALLLAPAGAAPDEYTLVEGTDVEVVLPPGFVKDARVNGFQNYAKRSMIMVDLLTGGLSQYRDVTTNAQQAAQGGKLLSKEDVEIDQGDAFLAKIERPMQGRVYRKWMIYVGDDRGVFRVSGVYDTAMEDEMSSVLKQVVLTARRSGSAEKAAPDLPDFTLKPEKPLVLVKKEPARRIYAEGGRYPLSAITDLMLTAGPSISKGTVEDRKKYAIARIKTHESVSGVKVGKSKKLKIDRLEAWEVLATATHKGTGAELCLFLTIIFDGDGYFAFLGNAGEHRTKVALKVFRKTVKGFKRKKAEKSE